MVSQVPANQSSLFKQARDAAEKELVESMKKQIKESVGKKKPEDDVDIQMLTVEIANKVFDTEYKKALAKTLDNQLDRNILFYVDQDRMLGRLIEVGKAAILESKV
jgi:hypothetical protein